MKLERGIVSRGRAAAVLAFLAYRAASAQESPESVQPTGAQGMTPGQLAQMNGGAPAYAAADVQFMSGMVGHHAQAIAMARWAPSHAASSPVRTLCERIIISQADEIKFMQGWLADRQQPIPEADLHGAVMPGMTHPMRMPGMLTPEQMAQLDQARGAQFDRLFLSDMIMHHRGALDMVHQVMTSPGAAQDAALFAYATDVAAGQTAEIGRMQRMLADIPGGQSRGDGDR